MSLVIPVALFILVLSLLLGITYGALSKEERINDSKKFADIILSTSIVLIIVLIATILYFNMSSLYPPILETPLNLTVLYVAQMAILTISSVVFTFVYTNVVYG